MEDYNLSNKVKENNMNIIRTVRFYLSKGKKKALKQGTKNG